MLVEAKRPVIYAGQGVHYAQAWQQLRELAELLEAPVTTSLEGKSAFPETIRCRSARADARCRSRCTISCSNADVIFGIGCSFATTNYGVAMPQGQEASSMPRSTPPT